MVMNLFEDHCLMFDVLNADKAGANVEEIGGLGCSLEAVLMDSAEHLARFHACHFND